MGLVLLDSQEGIYRSFFREPLANHINLSSHFSAVCLLFLVYAGDIWKHSRNAWVTSRENWVPCRKITWEKTYTWGHHLLLVRKVMMGVVSMAILALFLNEPTCFNLTANMVMFLNWKGELSIQFSKLIAGSTPFGRVLFVVNWNSMKTSEDKTFKQQLKQSSLLYFTALTKRVWLVWKEHTYLNVTFYKESVLFSE